ncbi:MAG: hypothetical protein KKF44_09985 [Nanoarchaeota archaeon]|nr:hypothetical protein [Nanoarchaeota archaeon]
MSVEEGFEKSPEHNYRSSKTIIGKLQSIVDLTLVHPGDYDLESGEILAGYTWDGGPELTQTHGRHIPTGDLFIIVGDETSKNIGVTLGRKQYAFLKGLEERGSFRHFVNRPSTEEMTLKDALIDLGRDRMLNVAKTFLYESDAQVDGLLQQYGALIVKPIFGCRGVGVQRIESLDDLETAQIPDCRREEHILQEHLPGPEIRIILLGGQLIASRICYDREPPWKPANKYRADVHFPTRFELSIAERIQRTLDADLIGVDLIGSKVSEINGMGTGTRTYAPDGRLLYDRTDDVVEYLMRKMNEDSEG